MRRIVVHALVGAAVLLTTASVVAGSLLTPAPTSAAETATSALPAPVQAAADRIAQAGRDDRVVSRDADRVAAAASAASVKRAGQLEKEQRAIAARQDALAKAKERERTKKAAAEKARQKRIAALGYEPGTKDPRSIARQILKNKYGYGADQYACFNDIIMRESLWDIDATNPSSGAYGIPQALPGSKMATVAPDWRTNPATQIIWAVGYMKDRYGSPCGAWGFKSANGWY